VSLIQLINDPAVFFSNFKEKYLYKFTAVFKNILGCESVAKREMLLKKSRILKSHEIIFLRNDKKVRGFNLV
jgi:hypothetical protein